MVVSKVARLAVSQELRQLGRAKALDVKGMEIVRTEANAAGATSANESWVGKAVVRGKERKVFVKPPEGERAALPGTHVGSLWRNEIAASTLASDLGIERLVTQAVEARAGGRAVEVQPFHEGMLRADSVPKNGQRFDRARAEILRAFDYAVGNPDRQGRNMMAVPTLGIDYGLAFPTGTVNPAHWSWPVPWLEGQTGKLLPSTQNFLKRIELTQVAKSLASEGVDPQAMKHVLRRFARLKADPSFLEIDAAGEAGVSAMIGKVGKAGADRHQGLPPATLNKIDRLVELVSAKRAKSLHPDGALLQDAKDKTIYLIEGGRRWPIPDPPTFERMKLKWTDVQYGVDPAKIRSIPQAALPQGSLIKTEGAGAVFLYRGGKRWHVPDPASFEAMGLDWHKIQTVPDDLIAKIPVSKTIPSLTTPAKRLPSATPLELDTMLRLARHNGLTLEREFTAGQNQYVALVHDQGTLRMMKVFRSKPEFDAVRTELSHYAAASTERLRSDAGFRQAFGDIIPALKNLGNGATLQSYALTGVPRGKLSLAAQAKALENAQRAMAAAKDVLNGMPISSNVENFLFNTDGSIAAWFDHLSHSQLQAHLDAGRRLFPIQ